MIRRWTAILLMTVIGLAVTACGGTDQKTAPTAQPTTPTAAAAKETARPTSSPTTPATQSPTAAPVSTQAPEEPQSSPEEPQQPQSAQQQETEDMTLQMTINNTPVTVAWEDNEAVAALYEKVKENPITIRTSMYGGFEQVGSLGMTLPQSDEQLTASAGDIMLYAGDQMVVFYGANTWAYTRLGHITDQTPEALTQLLSDGNVTITLSF
ncbi:cyclophilin-like fold protein [Ruminococcus sp.]|uniref:cyclophilin-like fold protein n=1 Tax=Ruminococcus sp. TaxID=41978 RepID=UPI00388E294F